MEFSAAAVYVGLSIAILATFAEPFVGVATWYVLAFLRPQDIYWYAFPPGERLSLIVAVATLLSLLGQSLVRRERLFVRASQSHILLAFWGWLYLSGITSVNPDRSSWGFETLTKILLFYLLATRLADTEARVRALVWVAVASLGLLALRGNYEYFVEGAHQIVGPGLPGTATAFEDRNVFGMHFVMVVPICYFLCVSERLSVVRWALALESALAVHAVFLTYSRGALVGLCVVAAAIVHRMRRLRWKVAAIAFSLLLVFVLAGPPVRQRFAEIFDYEKDGSAQGRFDAWDAGWHMMQDNPLFGVGLNNFDAMARRYSSSLATPKAAHNAFIQLGGDAGIPALLLYVALLARTVLDLFAIRRALKPFLAHSERARRLQALAAGLETSLFGFVACAMFLSLHYFEFYYFMVALVVALRRIVDDASFPPSPDPVPASVPARPAPWVALKRGHPIFTSSAAGP